MSTKNESQAAGPCQGIRVIEFAAMVAGPYCGQMLADMGAEVIKIEGIEGDGLRAVRPQHAGLGALFAQNNRGKRSISLDMKSLEGLAICREESPAVWRTEFPPMASSSLARRKSNAKRASSGSA